jgi:hypothetical protein
VTDESPFRRGHRRTGEPRGAQQGSVHNWRHGKRSAAFVAQRNAVMTLVRQCREAVEAARR